MDRRDKETTPIPPRHSGTTLNQEIPENNRVTYQEASVCTSSSRDCPGLQDRFPISERSHCGTPRGWGGLFSRPLRRHELMCNTCETSNNNAKGHSARQSYPGRAGMKGLLRRGITNVLPRVTMSTDRRRINYCVIETISDFKTLFYNSRR